MGNSSRASGCQLPTAPASAGISCSNGILARIPGDVVSEATSTLPPPTPGATQEIILDVEGFGPVRFFVKVKTARHHKSSHHFWSVWRAEIAV